METRLIGRNRVTLVAAGGIYHTGCASLKRILVVLVVTFVHHESWLWRGLPLAM